jgi:hypothetical protein
MRKLVAIAAAAAMLLTAQPVSAQGMDSIWSGWWAATDVGTPFFYGVSASWVEPKSVCRTPSPHGAHDLYSSWVGLGAGEPSGMDWLVQIGVITSCGGTGQSNTPTYEIFWEAVDTTVLRPDVMPPQHTADFVHAGDLITASVTSNNKGLWALTLDVNGKNRQKLQFTPTPEQKAKSHAGYEGLTAEAISESPVGLQQWPNFGSVTFTNIQVNTDPSKPWAPFSKQTALRTTDAQTLAGKLATKTGPVDPVNNSFTTTYLNP